MQEQSARPVTRFPAPSRRKTGTNAQNMARVRSDHWPRQLANREEWPYLPRLRLMTCHNRLPAAATAAPGRPTRQPGTDRTAAEPVGRAHCPGVHSKWTSGTASGVRRLILVDLPGSTSGLAKSRVRFLSRAGGLTVIPGQDHCWRVFQCSFRCALKGERGSRGHRPAHSDTPAKSGSFGTPSPGFTLP